MHHQSCIYPGSFDPFTIGHQSVVAKGKLLFPKIYIAVLQNPEKAHSFFNIKERVGSIEEIYQDDSQIEVIQFAGLLVDVMEEKNIHFILRGLRSGIDYEYEMQMAHTNRSMTQVETLFVPCEAASSYVSSSLVRTIAQEGRDVAKYVPGPVHARIINKLKENKHET